MSAIAPPAPAHPLQRVAKGALGRSVRRRRTIAEQARKQRFEPAGTRNLLAVRGPDGWLRGGRRLRRRTGTPALGSLARRLEQLEASHRKCRPSQDGSLQFLEHVRLRETAGCRVSAFVELHRAEPAPRRQPAGHAKSGSHGSGRCRFRAIEVGARNAGTPRPPTAANVPRRCSAYSLLVSSSIVVDSPNPRRERGGPPRAGALGAARLKPWASDSTFARSPGSTIPWR